MGLIVEERKGAVMVWTLDRPDRLNALPDLEDGEAFAAACEAVNADPSIRCVVMTGSSSIAHIGLPPGPLLGAYCRKRRGGVRRSGLPLGSFLPGSPCGEPGFKRFA